MPSPHCRRFAHENDADKTTQQKNIAKRREQKKKKKKKKVFFVLELRRGIEVRKEALTVVARLCAACRTCWAQTRLWTPETFGSCSETASECSPSTFARFLGKHSTDPQKFEYSHIKKMVVFCRFSAVEGSPVMAMAMAIAHSAIRICGTM